MERDLGEAVRRDKRKRKSEVTSGRKSGMEQREREEVGESDEYKKRSKSRTGGRGVERWKDDGDGGVAQES